MEIAPDNVVRDLFRAPNVTVVTHVIHNFYEHVEEIFGVDLAATMIDKESLQQAKSSHEVKKTHSQKIKSN